MIEQLNVTKIIAVNADRAWTAIRGIGGLERWFPIIDDCTVFGAGEGATRVMTLTDGAKIKDRIDLIDDQRQCLRYTRTESPFPVQSYVGTVEIRRINEADTKLSWTLEIDVQEDQRDALIELLRDALTGGILGLERDMQQPQLDS